jgi:L-alanine-DL-glutamate epimerase-like enolase superfamily enzyme
LSAGKRIGRVRAFALRYPEPNNDGKLRSITLVAVETEDGLTGWGEAISGAVEVSQGVAFMAERRLAPMILGRDPRDVTRLWAEMRDATFWDGTGGIVTFALSAVDMALWDLKGKIHGVPLYDLLGGRRRDRLRACASAIFASPDLDRIRAEFAGFAGEGYTCVKGGWGHDLSVAFGRDATRDVAIARTVREAVGQDVDVICDVVAHAGWTATHAVAMARRFADVGLYWLEDPLPEDDLEGYRHLRAAVPDLRLCTGEKGWTVPHYRRLLETGALDIVMSDPGRAEGVTGSHRIIELASRQGRAWNAHSWSSAVNTAAALHLAAAAENVLVFELKPLRSPMQHELVRTPIEQQGGWVTPPDGPGLGVDVDEAAIATYLVPD